MKVTIMIMSGPFDGLEIELDSDKGKGRPLPDGEGMEFLIGRRDECDLAIAYDTEVSRKHAFLRIKGAYVWLEDAGSRNGSLVRNRLVQGSAELKTGELFRVGHTWLRIQVIEQ